MNGSEQQQQKHPIHGNQALQKPVNSPQQFKEQATAGFSSSPSIY